jgi:phenylacetaldehyde dehydrogenase
VVLKPADETPLTALKLAELVLEAGYPEGVFNVVTGTGITAGSALTHNPLVDKLTFTGSTAVGQQIGKIAMDSMTRVTLELGGKSPTIVMADADLPSAAAGAASAIFFNQGQVCCAGARLYVQRKHFDNVVADIAGIANAMKLGNGLDPSVEMGPLISARQQARVYGYIELAGKRCDHCLRRRAIRAGVFRQANGDRRRRSEALTGAGRNLRPGAGGDSVR